MQALVIEVPNVAELTEIHMTMEGVFAVNGASKTRYINMTQLCIDCGLVEDEIYASERFQEACRKGLQQV